MKAHPSIFNFRMAGAAALALGLMATAAARATRIVSIHAAGSRRFTERQIIAASGLSLGMEVSREVLKKTCDRLGATGAFTAAGYRFISEGGGWAVTFQVTDASETLPCIFGNFVWFSARDLSAALARRVPLWANPLPFNGNLPEQVGAALQALLAERGIHASVSHTFYSPAPGAPIEAIEFKADGVPIPILRVDFRGATHVDAKALADAVKPLLTMNYDSLDVRAFLHATCGPLYWKQGFLRVGFGSPATQIVPGSTSEVAVTVPVSEDAQYDFAGIDWKGNQAISVDDLSKQINLDPGRPADGVRFNDDMDDVRNLYHSRGYLMARVTPKHQFDEGAHTVRYQVLIREGDQFRMGNLQILGLDDDLTRELEANSRLKPGDPFDQSYWKTFLKDNSHLLPRTAFGWKVGMKQFVHFDYKRVDVTIRYEVKTSP